MRRKLLLVLGLASFLMVGDGALAQDLIDDLPKERKQDAKGDKDARQKTESGEENRGVIPRLPGRGLARPAKPNMDLIDDLPPEQKQAAARRRLAEHPAGAIPESLDEALAQARRNSPRVLVAEAKVRLAQAELNEVRLSVAREMRLAFRRRAGNNEVVVRLDKALGAAGLLHPRHPDMEKLRQAILEDESRIIYLLGAGAESPSSPTRRAAGEMEMMGEGMRMMRGGMSPRRVKSHMAPPAPAQPRFDRPEKLQAFLRQRLDVDFEQQPLNDVLDYLERLEAARGDVSFVVKAGIAQTNVTLSLKQVSVEDVLQALADLTGHCFIFRGYGILVIDAGSGMQAYGAGLPVIGPGLPTRAPQSSKP